MIREQPMYTYNTATDYHTQRPQSYTSSFLSGRCPEGPEREDPKMCLTNGSLPLGPAAKKVETKPHLGKDEANILAREFKRNPKPTARTKRQFAEDMGAELARINVCSPAHI
jgi:hypothetical protein